MHSLFKTKFVVCLHVPGTHVGGQRQLVRAGALLLHVSPRDELRTFSHGSLFSLFLLPGYVSASTFHIAVHLVDDRHGLTVKT